MTTQIDIERSTNTKVDFSGAKTTNTNVKFRGEWFLLRTSEKQMRKFRDKLTTEEIRDKLRAKIRALPEDKVIPEGAYEEESEALLKVAMEYQEWSQ